MERITCKVAPSGSWTSTRDDGGSPSVRTSKRESSTWPAERDATTCTTTSVGSDTWKDMSQVTTRVACDSSPRPGSSKFVMPQRPTDCMCDETRPTSQTQRPHAATEPKPIDLTAVRPDGEPPRTLKQDPPGQLGMERQPQTGPFLVAEVQGACERKDASIGVEPIVPLDTGAPAPPGRRNELRVGLAKPTAPLPRNADGAKRPRDYKGRDHSLRTTSRGREHDVRSRSDSARVGRGPQNHPFG